MPYVGRTPSAVPVTADDIPANSIDASKIVDGAITIADIADDAVTAAKLANSINTEIAANTAKTGITSGQASAITANTAKVTNATHTGDVTGATALTIADNAVTLAKMAGGTDGQIITYDASGNPVTVGPGTDGQVLTSTGVGSPPAFETAAGGKVLQVVSGGSTTRTTSSSSTYITVDCSVSIQPSLTSSKILLIHHGGGIWKPVVNGGLLVRLYKDSSYLAHIGDYLNSDMEDETGYVGFNYLDSPSTTSSITYDIRMRTDTGSSCSFNTGNSAISIIAIEIGV